MRFRGKRGNPSEPQAHNRDFEGSLCYKSILGWGLGKLGCRSIFHLNFSLCQFG